MGSNMLTYDGILSDKGVLVKRLKSKKEGNSGVDGSTFWRLSGFAGDLKEGVLLIWSANTLKLLSWVNLVLKRFLVK